MARARARVRVSHDLGYVIKALIAPALTADHEERDEEGKGEDDC